jgi:hypothetical protein
MLVRYLVCSLLFAVLVFVVVGALNGLFTNIDFTGTAAIGIGFCLLVLAASYAWDHYERRNWRQ